jgi:hypothetical protein
MPEHSAGSETVSVSPRTRNFFFYRSMGISIEISPERHWWCLWLCSSTTSIDQIRCTISLSGNAGEAEANGQCTNCGSLNIMGPSFWGFNVPKPYEQVRYQGVVVIDKQSYSFEGNIVYS